MYVIRSYTPSSRPALTVCAASIICDNRNHIAYGTNVFGTYATVFPRNINLMVLDGNQSPRSELFENFNDKARVMNNRIDYFIASCEFTEGGCKVDLRTCLTNLDGVLRENSEDVRETFKVTPHSVFNLALMSMFENYDYVPLVCNVAVKNYDILRSYLLKYQKDHQPQIALQSGKEYQVDSESKPTSTVMSPISEYAVRAQGETKLQLMIVTETLQLATYSTLGKIMLLAYTAKTCLFKA